MADRYAVVGHPVAHSLSPRIHAAFAAQTGQTMDYTAIDIAPGEFEARVRAFFAAGGRGLNVTLPYKGEAYRLADSLSRGARQAGAVNTLWPGSDGRLHGDNTDGVGLVRDLTANQGWSLRGRRLLLLGAGGAVRGVLGPLLAEDPAQLVIANRTADKARQLAQAFGPRVQGCGYPALVGQTFDLVINGTSASLAGALPPLPDTLLAPGACGYDMMYGAAPTVFLRWAVERGAAACADGLGMLVEQAAEAFFLWRGLRPDTAPVLAALRAG